MTHGPLNGPWEPQNVLRTTKSPKLVFNFQSDIAKGDPKRSRAGSQGDLKEVADWELQFRDHKGEGP